jgi:acyl carrier protein
MMSQGNGDDVLEVVRTILERVAGPARMPSRIDLDTRLGDGGWLDSIELLDVVIACETSFGIAFDQPGDLENGSLETVGAFAALIRARRASGRPCC